ncbi:FAD-dependent oxidoreductase, partial [Mesorhizobium sp. M3A.F.Ca.ET.174.01.1.1]|uniref:FAD-dependent oxidoreductase n=1 Tax=unclassified Mesorhizobium TaxID=325217 RepID=UPI0010939860
MDGSTTISELEFDVVVVGGGSAGVAAAASASRAGARTILIERYGFAGGAATTSSVLAYCGLYANTEEPCPVVGGVAMEVLSELGKLGLPVAPVRLRATGNWIVPLNPEAVKVALDRTLINAGVMVYYHSFVTGAEMANRRLNAVEVCGHFGKLRISATAFVDASGEGDLCFFVDRNAFSENANIQPASYPLRIGGVSADWALDRSLFKAATQTYNASNPELRARENGGVVLRVPGASDLWWMALDLETNPCDGLHFSLAEVASRECAWRLVECLKGANPILGDCYLASSGPQIGVRESRHPQTIVKVKARDIIDAAMPTDTIALGGWPMEI